MGYFEAVRLPIDVADFHSYAVDWTADKADFIVDGELVRTCPRPLAYPLQMMLAVFDFPEKSDGTTQVRFLRSSWITFGNASVDSIWDGEGAQAPQWA